MFAIDPAFLATSEPLGDLGLCHARLQGDTRWPWIVLVPRAEGLRELEDLPAADRARLMEEIVAAGAAVRAVGQVLGVPVEKLNLGALGNVTPQLHAHVVGRRAGDPAWPGPVWGVGTAVAYGPQMLAKATVAARAALGL
ncbi:MAG TPA: HIT domain-containing protein [Phenylobacterium sp.]|nr:HIT domain-containing protein [Phenylobacterium sp.]